MASNGQPCPTLRIRAHLRAPPVAPPIRSGPRLSVAQPERYGPGDTTVKSGPNSHEWDPPTPTEPNTRTNVPMLGGCANYPSLVGNIWRQLRSCGEFVSEPAWLAAFRTGFALGRCAQRLCTRSVLRIRNGSLTLAVVLVLGTPLPSATGLSACHPAEVLSLLSLGGGGCFARRGAVGTAAPSSRSTRRSDTSTAGLLVAARR
jgi:hypothetical protein